MSAADAPSLDSLRQQLQDLRQALVADEDARAAELVRAYDLDLRRYVADNGTDARAALEGLLQLQNEAIVDMRQRRDAAFRALHGNRRSHRAARAYVRAGTL